MRRRSLSLLLAAVCALIALPHSAGAQSQGGPGTGTQGPLVVVTAPDAPSWVRLLRASGAAARVGTFDEALDRPAAIVSAGAGLSSSQMRRLKDKVTDGQRVVTANDAFLAELGVTRAAEREVTAIRMPGVEGDARWTTPLRVRPLEGASVAPVATAGADVIAGIASIGRGQALAVAVDPFGDNRGGYELLPGLGRFAVTFTGAPPGPSRTGAEVYLDPGSLHNGVSGTPEDLAKRLSGARAVHIAAWNADFQDPKFNYAYQPLIDALHARGVLAYAWIEPPFVSERFWLEHPECREKTATGRDAFVDWRRLIALEDPNCFKLAMPVYTRVVSGFPFDGVDVAELYFEPTRKRDDYTPFHPSALAQFGHDPNADPAGFRAFRTKLATELNRQVLQVLNGLPSADQLDFKITVIDNKLDPAFGSEVGSDIDALAQVAKETGATVQVEDPFTLWTQGPLRYDTLVPQLKGLMPPGFVYPAVNVVDREAGYPTRTMTGAEFDLAMSSAAQGAGLVGVYSAGTVLPADLAHLPGAVGGTASVTDAGITSAWTVNVPAPTSTSRRLTVDGKQWPVAAGTAVVPAGNHQLKWSQGDPKGPGLVRFTGELGTASLSGDSMTLSYDSRAAVRAVVDARPAKRESVPNPDGGFAVRLPPGKQTVTLEFPGAGKGGGGSGGWLLPLVVGGLVGIVAVWYLARRRRRAYQRPMYRRPIDRRP